MDCKVLIVYVGVGVQEEEEDVAMAGLSLTTPVRQKQAGHTPFIHRRQTLT
jgi:hypothetical protein